MDVAGAATTTSTVGITNILLNMLSSGVCNVGRNR